MNVHDQLCVSIHMSPINSYRLTDNVAVLIHFNLIR